MVVRLLPGKSEFTLVMTIRPESEPDAAGEVLIELDTGHRVSFELKGRYFRVLRVLIELAWQDRNRDLEVKGLRSRSVIARHYATQANDTATPADDVITRYVLEIRKAVKRAIAELVVEANISPPPLVPDVIATSRGLGYSMGDLKVILIDHTATRKLTRG